MADIINLNEQSFNDAITSATGPVLVDFWAPWCGPCKAIAPLLEEIAGELAGQAAITKVNVDENGNIASKYGVRAIPTLILFKDGKQVDTIVGMIGKDDLKAKIAAHV